MTTTRPKNDFERRNLETMRCMVRRDGWIIAEAKAKADLYRNAPGTISHAIACGIWDQFQLGKTVERN